MKQLSLLSGLVLLLALGPGPAEAEPKRPRDWEQVVPRTLPELEADIREVLAQTRTPGAGIALVSKDQVLFLAGLGLADVATGRPATPDTLFRLGSVSKGFIALAVLMLQEAGQLRLEDPVRPLAPEVQFENRWEFTDPIRIVHLLEHTTGFDDLTFREYASDDPRPLSLAEGLAFDPRARVARWQPGTRMAYCNAGPAIGAAIVERLTGMSFEEFARRRIFDPLGMPTATHFRNQTVERLGATLYHPDGVTPYPYWHLLLRPAGAVNASAREMARYVRLYLNRGSLEGRTLVSEASIDRMEAPETTDAARAGLRIGYGLSNYTQVKGGFVVHGHDGGVQGGLARIGYLPELGLGWVVLLNSSSDRAMTAIDTLIRNHLTRESVRPVAPPEVVVSEQTRAAFTGFYVGDSPREQRFYFVERLLRIIHLRFGERGFTSRPLLGKTRELVAVTDRVYREREEPVATTVLLDSPEGPRVASGWSSFRRVPAFLVYLQSGLLVVCLGAMLSALLFALVWVPRLVVKGRGREPALSVRLWPVLSVLLFAGSAALVVTSGEDFLARFGRPTAWSVGFCLGSWAFALTAVLALLVAFGPRSLRVRPGIRWHARVVALACALAVSYLGAFGIIGLRTWA